MNKEEIEKAKKVAKNYIADTPIAPYECLMNEERKSAIILMEYREQLEEKVRQLIKGQTSLMQSRKKWKDRYYKERRTRKEADKSVEQIYEDYQDIGKMFFELDEKVDKVTDKLKERIKSVEKCYEELLTDIGGVKIIIVTGLSKKEKEEVINKRNCLLVQKHCYEEILEMLGGKDGKDRRMEKHS